MADFYIEKIRISGDGKETSVVDLKEGLNIICGPSNTGKSYIIEIIDFLFGSSRVPFDKNLGYNTFEMVIKTARGQITVRRQLDVRKINVYSSDSLIKSGDYGTTNGKLNVNEDLWFKLMGIEDRHLIIKNRLFERQRLTVRSILHMFLIKEDNVIQRQPVLMPRQNSASPAFLAALYYLITGEDFTGMNAQVDKKIKEARKRAVIDYINERLSAFTKRKNELSELPIEDTLSLQEKAESILDDISGTEQQISMAVNRSKQLLKEIYALGEQLTECNTLYDRYQALKSQYVSDIKRLTFIVEGEIHKNDLSHPDTCPFCSGKIPPQEQKSYTEASAVELQRIKLQLNDLLQAESDIVDERVSLNERLQARLAEKEDVDALINHELKPKVAELKNALQNYRRAIEIQNESNLITSYEGQLRSELFEKMTEEDAEIEFKIKNHYNRAILDVIDAYLTRILEACKFDAFGSAYLSLSSFDVVVNGKGKETYGKGYRAFLNTIVAIAFFEYLSQKGKYSPALLAIDSPILSLKEKGSEQASDSMKSALFTYLLEHQSDGQIIIIENDIPELDYQKANVIRFTKDPENGRYGLLESVQ
jgi:hypothetical protein